MKVISRELQITEAGDALNNITSVEEVDLLIELTTENITFLKKAYAKSIKSATELYIKEKIIAKQLPSTRPPKIVVYQGQYDLMCVILEALKRKKTFLLNTRYE